MAKPQIILFDLDGTLIDSVRLILDSYHHTMRMHGLPARTDDDWLQGLGTPLTVQFADWGSDPETLQALIATYRTYNLEHHDRMVTVYPGIVEAVQAIRSAGVRTGLVTSKNRPGRASWSRDRQARDDDGRPRLCRRGPEPQAPP